MPKASERALGLAREVLAKIAAYDPYFPKPNEAMLIAWGEHISLKNPDRDDMLNAVTKFYDSNTDGSKPYPASITTLARSIRQDRLMRGDYVPPPDKSDDPDTDGSYMPMPIGSMTVSREQWEERHGKKFPEFEVGKGIPYEKEPGLPPIEGSGHVCDLPKVRKGEFWRCECGQQWMELDGEWRLCEMRRSNG